MSFSYLHPQLTHNGMAGYQGGCIVDQFANKEIASLLSLTNTINILIKPMKLKDFNVKFKHIKLLKRKYLVQ